MNVMGWLSRRKADRPGTLRSGTSTDLDHLAEFARTRGSVEAYLEPRTAVTDSTIVLVASTGEWTRRRVPSVDAARSFTQKNGIPFYDVNVVGYPRRMREWTAQRKASGQLGPPAAAEEAT